MLHRSFMLKIPIPIIIVFTWISIGIFTFHELEDWTWTQCFYYSVTTLTTVGYGDLVPTHDLSRFVAAWYILIGVTITLGALGYIGSYYLEKRMQKNKE